MQLGQMLRLGTEDPDAPHRKPIVCRGSGRIFVPTRSTGTSTEHPFLIARLAYGLLLDVVSDGADKVVFAWRGGRLRE